MVLDCQTAGRSGAIDRALADFQKAMELAPEHSYPYIGRARIYEFRHFLEWQETAENRRDLGIDERAKLVDDLLTVSDRAVEDYDRAIELCTKAL